MLCLQGIPDKDLGLRRQVTGTLSRSAMVSPIRNLLA